MTKSQFLILSAVSLMLASGPVLAAGSYSAGKTKSEDCADCHGADGRGDGDTIPGIAGMSVADFTKAFEEYRNGTRKSGKKMAQLGKKLSASDVADLAAYYAALKPAAE